MNTFANVPDVYFGTLFAVLLIWLAIIDFRELRLPNALVGLVALLGIARLIFVVNSDILSSLTSAALCGGLFYGVRAFFYVWRGIEGLGLGDVKLAAAGGLWIPPTSIGIMLLGACLMCAVMIVIRACFSGTAAIHQQQPFGTALCFALFACWTF